MTRAALGSLLVLLAVSLDASAQAGGNYAAVKTWYGTFSYRLSATVPTLNNGTAEVEATFEGTFTLKLSEDENNWWDGTIDESRARVRYRGFEQTNCRHTASIDADGPLTGYLGEPIDPPEVQLRVYPTYWNVNIKKGFLSVVERISGCGEDFQHKAQAFFPASTPDLPVPSSGSQLDGKFTGGVGGIPARFGDFQRAKWEGEFHLSPTRDDFILEVDSPEYKTWMPEDVGVGKPGTPIHLTATLKRKSGASAGVRISRMEWELVNTSREPGIAINYPLNARDSDPDMRFKPEAGQRLGDVEGQRLTTSDVKGGKDTVSILPYDWGGWTTVRVVAELEGGKKVAGKLKEGGEENIRVPKRRSGSLIADAWRDQMKKAGKDGADASDSSDDEKILHPNAFPGDGLTLYEEYRGFYEKGQHKRGDPSKRDLFVRDETEGFVDGGIATFERISGIVVHRLQPDEFDSASRVVNGNKSAGAHLVDQHAILITWIDKTGNKTDGSGLYFATVPPGSKSPADVKYIIVPRKAPDGSKGGDGKTLYADASFAHELMHAVGVRHHGPDDKYVYWRPAQGGGVNEYADFTDTGSVTVNGQGAPIRILGTSGTNDVTQRWATDHQDGQKQQVGIWGGQSSGDVRCIMRYDINGAYAKHGASNVRVLIKSGDEPVGYDICTSPTGTGINASTAPGGSRYGDATNGNCANQIRVSDKR